MIDWSDLVDLVEQGLNLCEIGLRKGCNVVIDAKPIAKKDHPNYTLSIIFN